MRWFNMNWLNANRLCQVIFRMTGDPGMASAVAQNHAFKDYNVPMAALEISLPPRPCSAVDIFNTGRLSPDALLPPTTNTLIELVISNTPVNIAKDAMTNATKMDLIAMSNGAETTREFTKKTDLARSFTSLDTETIREPTRNTKTELNHSCPDTEKTFNTTSAAFNFDFAPNSSSNIITPFGAVAGSLQQIREFYTIEKDSYLRWLPIQLLLTCACFFLRRCLRFQPLAWRTLNSMLAAMMLVALIFAKCRYGIENNKRDILIAVCCTLTAQASINPRIRSAIIMGVLGVVALPFHLIRNYVTRPMCHVIFRNLETICMILLVVPAYVYLWPIAYPEHFDQRGDMMIAKEIRSNIYQASRIPALWTILYAWFFSAMDQLSLQAAPHVEHWSNFSKALATWLTPLIWDFLKPVHFSLTNIEGTWSSSQVYAVEPFIARIGLWIADLAGSVAQSLLQSCGARCQGIHNIGFTSMTAEGSTAILSHVSGFIAHGSRQGWGYIGCALSFLWPDWLGFAQDLLIAIAHGIWAGRHALVSTWSFIGRICVWLIRLRLLVYRFYMIYTYRALYWIVVWLLGKLSGNPDPLQAIKQFLDSCNPYAGHFDQKAVDLYLVLGHIIYWRTADQWGRRSPYGSQIHQLLSGKSAATPTSNSQGTKEIQDPTITVSVPARTLSTPQCKTKVGSLSGESKVRASNIEDRLERQSTLELRLDHVQPAQKLMDAFVVTELNEKLVSDDKTPIACQELQISPSERDHAQSQNMASPTSATQAKAELRAELPEEEQETLRRTYRNLSSKSMEKHFRISRIEFDMGLEQRKTARRLQNYVPVPYSSLVNLTTDELRVLLPEKIEPRTRAPPPDAPIPGTDEDTFRHTTGGATPAEWTSLPNEASVGLVKLTGSEGHDDAACKSESHKHRDREGESGGDEDRSRREGNHGTVQQQEQPPGNAENDSDDEDDDHFPGAAPAVSTDMFSSSRIASGMTLLPTIPDNSVAPSFPSGKLKDSRITLLTNLVPGITEEKAKSILYEAKTDFILAKSRAEAEVRANSGRISESSDEEMVDVFDDEASSTSHTSASIFPWPSQASINPQSSATNFNSPFSATNQGEPDFPTEMEVDEDYEEHDDNSQLENQEEDDGDAQMDFVFTNREQERSSLSVDVPTGASLAASDSLEPSDPVKPSEEPQSLNKNLAHSSVGTAQQDVGNLASLGASISGQTPVPPTPAAKTSHEIKFQDSLTGLFGTSARSPVPPKPFAPPAVRPPSVNYFSGGQAQPATNEVLRDNNLTELLSTGFEQHEDDDIDEQPSRRVRNQPARTTDAQLHDQPDNAPTHAPIRPEVEEDKDDSRFDDDIVQKADEIVAAGLQDEL